MPQRRAAVHSARSRAKRHGRKIGEGQRHATTAAAEQTVCTNDEMVDEERGRPPHGGAGDAAGLGQVAGGGGEGLARGEAGAAGGVLSSGLIILKK